MPVESVTVDLVKNSELGLKGWAEYVEPVRVIEVEEVDEITTFEQYCEWKNSYRKGKKNLKRYGKTLGPLDQLEGEDKERYELENFKLESHSQKLKDAIRKNHEWKDMYDNHRHKPESAPAPVSD
jgi:hypothetical protein